MNISKPCAHRWTTKGRTMVLTLERRQAVRIVQDDTYPAMWRVDLGNGRVSDALNLSRATDRALELGQRQVAARRPAQSRPRLPWGTKGSTRYSSSTHPRPRYSASAPRTCKVLTA